MKEDVIETIAEAARLRTDFLNCELDLVRTFLDLARTESDMDDLGTRQALDLASQGIRTIRRYMDRLSASERKPIARALAGLERQATDLRSQLVKPGPVHKHSGRTRTAR